MNPCSTQQSVQSLKNIPDFIITHLNFSNSYSLPLQHITHKCTRPFFMAHKQNSQILVPVMLCNPMLLLFRTPFTGVTTMSF